MKASARLYNGARCHCQVIICSRCDRGHRYCFKDCARIARRESSRRATARYAATRRGRQANAERQRRYRRRRRQRLEEKATHHASAAKRSTSLLSAGAERVDDGLESALNEAIKRDVVHLHAVRQVLEQRREARDEPSPVGTPVTANEQTRRLVVRPASLAGYAHLIARDEERGDDDEQ